MATYMATSPDGGKYRITAPDNATPEQLTAYAQKNIPLAPKPAITSDGMGTSQKFDFNKEVSDLQTEAKRQETDGKGTERFMSAIGNVAKDAYHGVVDPIEEMGAIAKHPTTMKRGDIPMMASAFIPGFGKAAEIPEAAAFERMGMGKTALKEATAPDAVQDVFKKGISKANEGLVAMTGAKPLKDEKALTEQMAQGLSTKYDSLKDAKNAAYGQANISGAATPVHDISNIDILRKISGQVEDAPQGYTPGFDLPHSDKSMPREINSGADLINMRQSLNKRMQAELKKPSTSPLIYDDLKEKIKQVNLGLDEAKAKSPQFAKELDAADALHKRLKETYGGEIAQQLHLDENLFKAMKLAKTTNDPELSKVAFRNAVAATRELVPSINTEEQIDFLKDGLERKDFEQLMADKLNYIIEATGTNPVALKENRPLMQYILKGGIGIKTGKVDLAFDDLQAALDKFGSKQAGISLGMQPEKYRGKDPAVERAKNLAKAAVMTATTHGKPTAYAGAKVGEAIAGVSPAGEAKAYMTLKKELNPKAPPTIPGAAIGAYIGGSNERQQ